MKIFFASSHELSAPIAKKLIDLGLISGFITNPDKPSGRKREISPNGFAIWAQKTQLPIYKTDKTAEISSLINKHSIDLIITCAFGLFISEELLKIPKFGWLNIHFSLLPKYRGAAPAQRALMNGDSITGISIFKLNEGLDTGDILYKEEYHIPKNIGSRDLLDNLANIAANAMPKLLKDFSSAEFMPQDGQPSFAPKIQKSENKVNWESTSKNILNLYRGLEINGGLHAIFRGEKVLLLKMTSSEIKLQPGEIKVIEEDLMVGTGDASVRIHELKPAGKNAMSAKEWLNGARLTLGEKFE